MAPDYSIPSRQDALRAFFILLLCLNRHVLGVVVKRLPRCIVARHDALDYIFQRLVPRAWILVSPPRLAVILNLTIAFVLKLILACMC